MRLLGLEFLILVDIVGVVCLIVEENDFIKGVLVLFFVVEIYNLKIFKEFMEDVGYNIICFLLFVNELDDVDLSLIGDGILIIISFVFEVRNVLVVFYKVLGGFVINGVNMIKFELY